MYYTDAIDPASIDVYDKSGEYFLRLEYDDSWIDFYQITLYKKETDDKNSFVGHLSASVVKK